MRQEIIAEANRRITNIYFNHVEGDWVHEGWVDLSCFALLAAIDLLTRNQEYDFSIVYSKRLLEEYREFSGAREDYAGFHGIDFQSGMALQQYRQEMLYYFWMANQEM